MRPQIEIISRLLIVRQGKILLCRLKTEDWYFLPGGHLEFGETIGASIRREMREELRAKTGKIRYLGTVQNFFGKGGNKRHELNIIFRVDIPTKNLRSRENHIEFSWHRIQDLARAKILPTGIKRLLPGFIRGRSVPVLK